MSHTVLLLYYKKSVTAVGADMHCPCLIMRVRFVAAVWCTARIWLRKCNCFMYPSIL